MVEGEEKSMDIEKTEKQSMDIEKTEKQGPHSNGLSQEHSINSHVTKWGLILLNAALATVGNIAGPMLTRLYYMHGGTRKWMYGWLQAVGFPLLLIPITFAFLRDHKSNINERLASPKLLAYGVAIGLLTGVTSVTYSFGLSFLPVSTVMLLLATNLAFTAVFAKLIVKKKFTPYSINAIVLMISGAVLLGISKNSDRLPGVSTGKYFLGFFLVITTAAVTGLVLPSSEYAYSKSSSKRITYSVVLQFLVVVNFLATVFCSIGMLANKDFSAIRREAREFELGPKKYYLILVSSVVSWQMVLTGTMGLVFCTSSLAAGVFGALMLPLTEISSVIVFHEKFNGQKGMALMLCLWGFTSYFYGSYRENKRLKANSTCESA